MFSIRSHRFYLLVVAVVLLTLPLKAQTPELFEPYQSIGLRLPSVPLIVNDPYLSIWSPYNKLTDGTTRHWSDAEKAWDGLLRVDSTVYRWMGKERDCILSSIAPMTDEVTWKGRVTHSTPSGSWTASDYDDSSWALQEAAWGTAGEYPRVKNVWKDTNSDIYIRRRVTLTAEDLEKDLWVVFSHDDVFDLYVNGTRVVSTGETWLQGEKRQLTTSQKAALHEGENIIAAHCHNTTGGAYVDFGLYANTWLKTNDIKTAKQLECDVLATSTYYTFACGPVELDVVFTAPMIIDDLDLLSTPINYISTQVRSTDGAEHDVQLFIATTPQMTVNEMTQRTTSTVITENGVDYIRSGSVDQPVLGRTGDMISIDWGYLYIPAVNGTVSVAPISTMQNAFVASGALAPTEMDVVTKNESEFPSLAYAHDFGSTMQSASYMMVGYDEVYDIQYMKVNYKGYWARNGKTIFAAFEELRDGYTDIMARCRAMDQRIYDDALASGNEQYAELLSGSYRHVIAAHKLFEDKSGNLMFFSKENNSNGCVNTVDLTYPSAPLFLLYNPDLQRGMMTSIFEYSYTNKWSKAFAAHDLGTYPKANGQVYGGDMPIEESGNMLILAATICRINGYDAWMRRYYRIAKRWADYLVANGQDPAEQLCTDDFAGHWAHNCNLSIKAIMGIAGFAEICRLKGDEDLYQNYLQKAADMAEQWEKDAKDGSNHYRLAFDRTNTWSQKYNMVWDKIWGTNLFPNGAMEREIKYYRNKQNTYGLPLDSRADYSKSDWIMWTAAMASDTPTFLKFLSPLYRYANTTTSRVPLSDWYDTKTGKMVGFRARSVIGGHWMKVLVDHFNEITSVMAPSLAPEEEGFTPYFLQESVDYDLQGRPVAYPEPGTIVLRRQADGTVVKRVAR